MKMAQMGTVFKCLEKLNKVKILLLFQDTAVIIKLNKKANESEMKWTID
jgi:hypothetical protein